MAGSLPACWAPAKSTSKQYLNDVLTIDSIFTSKANVDQYLANIYSSLPDEMVQRFPPYLNAGVWEAASDDAEIQLGFRFYTNEDEFERLEQYLDGNWFSGYLGQLTTRPSVTRLIS